MSADQRFIELWNDYLEGELDQTAAEELRRLLAQDNRLVQMAADSYRTHRLLKLTARDSASDQEDFVVQTMNRLSAQDEPWVDAAMRQLPRGTTATTRPPTRSLDTWRWIMRSPVSQAAVLVLAIVGVALWFHGGGATFAFADFVAPIIEAKTAKFKTTTEIKGPPAATITGEVMVLGATRMRQELETPNMPKAVMIFDWGQGKSITLDPASKKAVVVSVANLTKQQVEQQDFFGSFRSILLDARDNPNVKRESLGEKEIDGRRVVGFRVNSSGMVVSLWGDPKTGLPVLAETTMALYPDAKTTMSDFVFNVDMDESLFSLEPPAGYTVENMEVDVSPCEEKDLIEMFRQYSKWTGGAFPDSLDMQTIMQTVGKVVGLKFGIQAACEKLTSGKGLNQQQLQKFEELVHKIMDWQIVPGRQEPNAEETQEMLVQMYNLLNPEQSASGKGKPDEEQVSKIMQAEMRKIRQVDMPKMMEAAMKKVMDVQTPIQRGLLFAVGLPIEADAHYAGKGVRLGAADTPIFWYRPEDSKQCRIVYADLSVSGADTPPTVPDAQPVPDPTRPNQ